MDKSLVALRKKVSKWLSGWIANEAIIESFWTEPNKYLNEYIEGRGKAILLPNRLEELAQWHLKKYLNAKVVGEQANNELSESALSAHARLILLDALSSAGKKSSILVTDAALYLSLIVLASRREEAKRVSRILRRGLDTSLLDLRHTDRHEKGTLYRHFWLLMHLLCDVEDLPLDISRYSFPESMSPYDDVIAQWRTTDEVKVRAFVNAMADFHIKEARTTAHDEIAEFDTEDRMIFPYEILAFLRMREWIGLSNPASFDHPLMNQPLAALPSTAPLERSSTPLLDDVLNKFKQEYPESFIK